MKRPVLSDRYSLGDLLGEGGSGRVFRVGDSIRARDLALKIVNAAESEFLRREFDTLRHIRHENLIQVFDWGTTATGEAYYTMELVEGEEWGRRMGEPQDEREVRRILTGVLRGLAHLHCHGEIHGDLKPGNVLLGRGGHVRLTDVGMGGSAGRAESVSGTPGYAAPEVWEGHAADERSDLYSLGVMVYEALTGRHPFGGRTIRDVIAGQMEGWVPSPAAHGVRVAPDLERAIMRAVDRDPDLRQGTADEFMEGLGIGDRVGSILGGRFADRTIELSRLQEAINDQGVDAPTIVYVIGEPGVGKSALLRELADRVHVAESRGFQLNWRDGPLAILKLGDISHATERPEPNSQHTIISSAAEYLRRFSQKVPLALIFDPGPPSGTKEGEWIRELGRYLWAMSQELGQRPRLLLLVSNRTAPDDTFEFETQIRLAPFARVQCDSVLAGYLGHLALPEELPAWVYSVTGGNPAMLLAAIEALVARGSLARERGAWQFREMESIRSLTIPSLSTTWALRWKALRSAERVVLQALSLVRDGLPADPLIELTDGECDEGALRGLEARGWIRLELGHWRIASQAAEQIVRDSQSPEMIEGIAAKILQEKRLSIDRETRASFILATSSDSRALAEGIWAADVAMERGQYARAVTLLERCTEVAIRLDDRASMFGAKVRLGEALHQQGKDPEALEMMEGALAMHGIDAAPLAHGNRLLGEISAAVGKLSRAREALDRSIALADAVGDKRTYFGAHSALAEIDWRHGDEETRTLAVSRMEKVVASLGAGSEDSPESASLVYQLGAALIVLGKRDKAVELLAPTYSLTVSPYWKMRIANALATAIYYLGRFDEALEWLDDAWTVAEQSGFDSFKARIHSNRAGLLYSKGRFSEAVESHRIASKWARRTGSAFELGAAALGAAVNLILLAQYEDAIREIAIAKETTRSLSNQSEIAKVVEMEALARYYIGDHLLARSLIRDLQTEMPSLGGDQVEPRLVWLLARIAADSNEFDVAEELLARAEAVLRETRDWEDLPGVQIELAHLKARRGDTNFRLESLAGILEETEGARSPVVQLQGALAISDCIRRGRGAGSRFDQIVLDGLRLAERSGAREYAWRLSFDLGELAARAGDIRTAQARFATALRIFREIADRLEPSNRRLYLGTSHGALLIERVTAYRGS